MTDKRQKAAKVKCKRDESLTKQQELKTVNSCGHTTDFYLGKTDLPGANSSKICLGKFISGFVLPR